jgi:hypothetical protein
MDGTRDKGDGQQFARQGRRGLPWRQDEERDEYWCGKEDERLTCSRRQTFGLEYLLEVDRNGHENQPNQGSTCSNDPDGKIGPGSCVVSNCHYR